ncbi:DMT family protein [Limnoglobus roseus]|uniref:DMT family protein n=1 Tax=Limnoglobus roseus TaxID=2598579 RepID=A0A5C1ABM8_9BACT|nr:DMT family protein [Limnoglobus roseus]QEL14554.1 hypothetical protein PX52LOC_01444 [Limnoglobus roseus]
MRTIVFTVLLLVGSNTFMTIAWYGHLKHKDKALLTVMLVSWLIALPEYLLQVPANRMGSDVLTGTQLKLIQEVVTLAVFVVFAWVYLGEAPTWRTAAAFALVVAAVALVRGEGKKPPEDDAPKVEASERTD